jgi:hypothetical protein
MFIITLFVGVWAALKVAAKVIFAFIKWATAAIVSLIGLGIVGFGIGAIVMTIDDCKKGLCGF